MQILTKTYIRNSLYHGARTVALEKILYVAHFCNGLPNVQLGFQVFSLVARISVGSARYSEEATLFHTLVPLHTLLQVDKLLFHLWTVTYFYGYIWRFNAFNEILHEILVYNFKVFILLIFQIYIISTGTVLAPCIWVSS